MEGDGALMESESWNWVARKKWKSVSFCMYCRRIPGDLQQTVFTVAGQSDETWDTLFNMYVHATYDSEKRKMLKGLASTQNPQRLVQ